MKPKAGARIANPITQDQNIITGSSVPAGPSKLEDLFDFDIRSFCTDNNLFLSQVGQGPILYSVRQVKHFIYCSLLITILIL